MLLVVKRGVPVLLILCFGALGSGLLGYAHNAVHALQDAREVAHAFTNRTDAMPAPAPAPAPRHHDETNCDLHAQLSAPLMHSAVVPLLVFLGLLVAFLTQLAPPLVTQRVITRLDCRGPPPCRN
jgi:hypothetical protein